MRKAVVGLAVAGLVLAGASPAQALAESAVASGSVGSVDATFDGAPLQVDPLAACDTAGSGSAVTSGDEVAGFYEFGPGSSTCTLDASGVASADVSGELFRLDVLRAFGGPRIRVTDYSVECGTTETGSSASWYIGGLSGIRVPPELPSNHVVTIPGSGPGAPPLAEVTLNETIVPEPPDGSMTVNMMRIHLFPEGGNDEVGGEIVVGSVSCAPF
ncbi:choice-of-anchor P family protein [Actinophytocola sp.]|uniref:choice-of-anchor P family protein n=1 Tax=Actinophytocola sp. TaxID=1872138 RepID=UPI003D6C52F0